MAVKVVALVTLKSGTEDAFLDAARICISASRREPGVLRYDLWHEADGERRFVFDELYRDDEAVQAHMTADHFAAFGRVVHDLAATPPSIIVTHAVAVATTNI